jgi:hypothetical protein
VTHRRPLASSSTRRAAVLVLVAACGATPTATPPPASSLAPAWQPLLRRVEPPAGPGAASGYPVVAARVLAVGDSQLRWLYGRRTFAQSPFADRYQGIEVAIRPAALDAGGDLLLDAFLAEHRHVYPGATLVYTGDAADLSCTWEYDRFFATMARAGELPLLMVTSNHDGFYAGNFTGQDDAEGRMRFTDMPTDWLRACSEPGSTASHILTRAAAAARIAAVLPPAMPWATSFAPGDPDAPSGYAASHLDYVRPLGGGDPGAPPAWGVFLDTVDYRDFDVRTALGAGTVGSISAAQLRELDHALFEVQGVQPDAVVVAFGHHTLAQLDPEAQQRVERFLETHPQIVAVVTAHTHFADERSHTLPSGRVVPELVVGSTTDFGGAGAPESARLVEVRVDPRTGARGAASWRLELDVEALCAGIPAFAPRDPLGYTSYRLERDDTGDVPTSTWGLFWAWLADSDLGRYRVAQTAGALLVENRLVRDLAYLYRAAPGPLDDGTAAELDALVRRARSTEAAWGPTTRPVAAPGGYDDWWDPVLKPWVPALARTLLSFGGERLLFDQLERTRTADPERRRWFTCHAARAAEAEALRPTARDHVYVP